MTQSKHVRTRVRILVKAFPQHSDKYQETVCCAGVTEDAKLIRLYPITYRRLAKEHQFNRYDVIEAILTKASNDGRPESFRVDHDSIKVIERSTGLSDANKVRLWQPHIVTSLTALEAEHRAKGRSLGIIQPDPASIKFSWREAEEEDQADDGSGVRGEHPDSEPPFHYGQHGQATMAIHCHRPLAFRPRSAGGRQTRLAVLVATAARQCKVIQFAGASPSCPQKFSRSNTSCDGLPPWRFSATANGINSSDAG
jgi:hypothetical protein